MSSYIYIYIMLFSANVDPGRVGGADVGVVVCVVCVYIKAAQGRASMGHESCTCVYMTLYIRLCVFMTLYIRLCVYRTLYTCIYDHVYITLYICLRVYMTLYTCIHDPVYASMTWNGKQKFTLIMLVKK